MALPANQNEGFHLYYQNVRGMRTKVNDISLEIQSEDYDFLLLTETWLNNSFSSSEIFDSNYVVHRSDRDVFLSGKGRGGGVLVAVKSCIKLFSHASTYSTSFAEAVIVPVKLLSQKFLICCFYIVPKSPLHEYNRFFDFFHAQLIRLNYPSKILIAGDFNCKEYVNSNFSNPSSDFVSEIHNFASTNDLTQINNVPNTFGNTLDLVFSSFPATLKPAISPISREDPLHPSLVTHFLLPKNSNLSHYGSLNNRSDQYNFKKADFLKLYQTLSGTSFLNVYNSSDVDDACSQLYQHLYFALDLCVPKKSVQFNNHFPIYYTKDLICKIKRKNLIYKKIKRAHRTNITLCDKYKRLRTLTKQMIRKCFSDYIKDCEFSLKTDPKKMWQFSADKMNKKPNLPNSLLFDGELLSEPQAIADKFANFFEQSFLGNETCDNNLSNLFQSATNNFSDFISENEVGDAIIKIKSSTGAGPDRIPGFIFKGCAEPLISPLCHTFNLALKTSVFPDCWKISRICPVFKSGDRNEGSNYRPISIINSLAKIFEIILCDRLSYFVKNYLAPEQHGFCSGRSTITNLLSFYNEAISCSLQTDVIYFDFKKAFDLVDHSILISKLYNNFDIPPYLILILKSYLADRLQFVKFNGCSSRTFTATSGVPQGSHLGPLLFNCFINDLPLFIKHSKPLLYADDLKIFRTISSSEDADLLQNDVDSVVEWSSLNKSPINSRKCYVVSYRKGNVVSSGKIQHYNYLLHGSCINRSNIIKDLGVLFEANLSFSAHISDLVNKCSRTLGFVFRISKNFDNLTVYKLLYNSLVRSKLEYGAVIWRDINQTQSNRLECVQKRFLRFLYFKTHNVYPHYRNHPVRSFELRAEFGYLRLQDRRDLSAYILIFKLLNNIIDSPCLLDLVTFRVPIRFTRQRNLFHYSTCAVIDGILRDFNTKLEDIDPFVLGLNAFKKAVLNVLVEG